MAVISIDYNEPNTKEYMGVGLYVKGEDFNFNTGNFPADWYLANRHFARNYQDEPYLVHSSSVDHFFMDGADYDTAYLYVDGDVGALQYERDHRERMEFYVEPGTRPTWKELTDLAKGLIGETDIVQETGIGEK